MGSSAAASDDEEEEGFDWNAPLFAAARGQKAAVPASEGDLDLPEERGLEGVALARRALDEGASLVATEPASGLTALQLASAFKVVAVVRYLQMRYVRAMAAGGQAPGSDDGYSDGPSSEVALPDEIGHDPTAQLVEAVAGGDVALARQARAAGALLSTINVGDRKLDLDAIERNEADEAGYEELGVAKHAVHQLELLLGKNTDVCEFIEAEVQSAPQALLEAARIGNIKMARQARAAGAELEVADSEYSYTPLLWAARVGSTELITYLLDEGAQIDSRAATGSYRGSTPLLEATAWSNVLAMEMLLKHKPKPASIDAIRGDGATPLCIAAWVGHEVAVRVLLEHNASITHRFEGKSAIQLAKKHGHHGVAQLIRDDAGRRKREDGDRAKNGDPKDNWLRRKQPAST
jgi:hypothetical protein